MKKERYFRDELRRMFILYAIVPALVFTLVCGLVFMAALISGRKSSNEEHNKYAAGELNRVLEGYEQELQSLSENRTLFTDPIDDPMKVRVFEEFYQVSNSLGYEADLYLMDEDRQIILSSRQDVPDEISGKAEISWGIIASMDQKPHETAVRLLNPWKNENRSIALGRSVGDEGETYGYVVFTISSGQFERVLDRSDTQTILADRFGWVFLTNNYNFVDSSNQVWRTLRDTDQYLTYDNHMYLVSRQMVYGGLFEVYSISDIQNIIASLVISGTLIAAALIFMTVWVLISSRKVTEKKTSDFYRILDVMDQARNGNLDSMIQIESENEFRIIADAYNETITSLKRQMENNRRMTELVAIAQNRQLESQFNPHFLYNTLENIRYMCKLEPATAQRMVFSLSNLLRYSMDGNKEVVTLKEDLDHLENYLTILKYRFNRRLAYEIDVEQEAMSCRIPKLILQPMIENSVKYGFGNQENLSVELKAYLHEGKMILICRDDGVGMTPAILSELTALLSQEENNSRHSGIYNIHRRIEILYGRPYGVEIRSTEGHGTTLVVTLPVSGEGE